MKQVRYSLLFVSSFKYLINFLFTSATHFFYCSGNSKKKIWQKIKLVTLHFHPLCSYFSPSLSLFVLILYYISLINSPPISYCFVIIFFSLFINISKHRLLFPSFICFFLYMYFFSRIFYYTCLINSANISLFCFRIFFFLSARDRTCDRATLSSNLLHKNKKCKYEKRHILFSVGT